ncbi:urease accessory protein UreF [Nocardioides anomalus]|uniref:Urease accessory protein UreF n=1 Tax=Nocardioides anomalus TaxID=2712223 RepID=A0A6G6WD13_9ACTN|nr:urease accessory UreF family protein [Nocardioides anomalus]QIG43218.1 urease accessory protein UreF [Nocardioides anomalus]
MNALALLLADARLPAAGHTQSAQLEPALAAGLAATDPAADLAAYCRTRLATVVRTEAATAVVARHHALTGRPLAEVETAWAARTPSDAMRATARLLGRGLLRLARRTWPAAARHWTSVDRPPRAVVLGAVAAETGLAARELVTVVAYDDVQTVLGAALKLLPLDPADATAWCVGLLPDVDRLADVLSTLTATTDIPATGSPQIEAWAQAHALTTRRLFSA